MGGVIIWNRSAEITFSCTRQEAIGYPLTDVIKDSPIINVVLTGKHDLIKIIKVNGRSYIANRRDKNFVKINCAAILEHLLESELFGYAAGSFTGANKEGKTVLLEAADGGTIFLDEIGDMPMSVQSKILRVLQEKEVLRIGDVNPRKIDVRFISATNHPGQHRVQQTVEQVPLLKSAKMVLLPRA